MNAKDKERVQAATGQQQPQSEQPSPTFNDTEVNGAKVRSMLRKKSLAAQAVEDANADVEFYFDVYNAELERLKALGTMQNTETACNQNRQANTEVKQDFFTVKAQMNEALVKMNNYQIAPPSGSRFLLNSSSN